MSKRRKALAFIVTAVIVLAAVAIPLSAERAGAYENGALSASEALLAKSVRRFADATVIADASSPYYSLIATPVALYYSGSQIHKKPLLLESGGALSKPVEDFMDNYGMPQAVYIGSGSGIGPAQFEIRDGVYSDNPKDASLQAARKFWISSDTVMIIRESGSGYSIAVSAASIASYLNIPIIVSDKMDSKVAETLAALGVKSTITCGDIRGYGKTLSLKSADEATSLAARAVQERTGSPVSYIAITNPLDVVKPAAIETKTFHFAGKITNSDAAAYPGMAPTNPADSPSHKFDIPSDYKYAEVELDVKMDISGEEMGDFGGGRIYAYVGVDGDNDCALSGGNPKDKVEYMGQSLAYENIGYDPLAPPYAKCQYGWLHSQIPLFNDMGNHTIQLLARLPTTPSYTSTYTVDITVKKLDTPVYPLMKSLSSLAPYLAAARSGVVMAKEDYSIFHNFPTTSRCNICGDTEATPEAEAFINAKSEIVKDDLDALLADLAGIGAGGRAIDKANLANYYADRIGSMHIGIIADTNMVPQYLFKSKSHPTVPSDMYYSDIDIMPEKWTDVDSSLFSFEVPVGRLVGWDAVDVGALIARTIFYDDIIENIQGPQNGVDLPAWKDSAMATVGTNDPVGLAQSAAVKLGAMWDAAGFTASTNHNLDASRRQRSAKYYESASFIYYAAHGNYYWYVPPLFWGEKVRPEVPERPTPFPPIGEGGAFDVAHVKYMTFGPSVVMGTSCTTGRIDGLQAYNTLTGAFLHAGANAFIGGTRSVWGADYPTPDADNGEQFSQLLTMYTYAYLTGKIYDKKGGLINFDKGDATIGSAFMKAKNLYFETEGSDGSSYGDDIVTEYNLYGDPAFNPYEPNHEGALDGQSSLLAGLPGVSTAHNLFDGTGAGNISFKLAAGQP